MKKILVYISKLIMILFVIVSLVLLFIAIFKPDWIKFAIEWMGNLITTLGPWNYLIAFTSALAESLPVIGSLVPGMNIMILVGGFWGKMYIVETIIFASVGAMLGNYFGYFLGQKYGTKIIANYGDYVGIGVTEQKIMERQIGKNGFWYIVLGKFHGTLRAFIPFIAGAGGMHAKNFWTYNAIGSIIWATTINLIGYFFIDNYEQIVDNIGKIVTVITILVIGYLFLFQRESLKKYWEEKTREMEEKYPSTK